MTAFLGLDALFVGILAAVLCLAFFPAGITRMAMLTGILWKGRGETRVLYADGFMEGSSFTLPFKAGKSAEKIGVFAYLGSCI